MKDKVYDNADSFASSFDEEWQKVKCQDLNKKIDKVIENISDHPFVLQSYDIFNLLANSFIKCKSSNVNKLRILIKEDSKHSIGLTGNLEIDNNGSRIYGYYIFKKACYYNNIFNWKKVDFTN